MKECKKCYHPATGNGLCPYHGGRSIPKVLRQRKITRRQLRNLSGYSDRTIDRIRAGTRELSELELRGLLTVDNRKK